MKEDAWRASTKDQQPYNIATSRDKRTIKAPTRYGFEDLVSYALITSCDEIFSPMIRHASIRTMLSLVVHFDMELEQMDVKTTFLHGELEETMYMVQLEGFIQHG